MSYPRLDKEPLFISKVIRINSKEFLTGVNAAADNIIATDKGDIKV